MASLFPLIDAFISSQSVGSVNKNASLPTLFFTKVVVESAKFLGVSLSVFPLFNIAVKAKAGITNFLIFLFFAFYSK